MPQKQLPKKQMKSYVSLKTTYDFKMLALNFARIKRSIGILRKNKMQEGRDILSAASLAHQSATVADESIALMKKIRSKVKEFERSI